jgi:sulfite exporter TauE/SafE
MDNSIIIAFITGLTAGGLSCFAVQGGLLTGAFAQPAGATNPRSSKAGNGQGGMPTSGLFQATLLFILAKLIAYTLLGFVLGWLGSILTLSPAVKGILQIAIGVFLVGNAFRMLDIHPIFRYFTFQPPGGLTRYIRRASKGNDQVLTPLFLGTLTILIPCGVTQAVMAVAIGSGSPWAGAAILFAFILGTSPTFLGITVLVSGLAKAFQKYFNPVVTVIVLALGLYTINGGLNIMGSPYSVENIARSLDSRSPALAAPLTPDESSTSARSSGKTVVQIAAGNSGYTPETIVAPANQPIELHLVTKNTFSCSRSFVIPALNMMKVLPASGDTVFQIPAQPPGSALNFTCSMGMYGGVIRFQ